MGFKGNQAIGQVIQQCCLKIFQLGRFGGLFPAGKEAYSKPPNKQSPRQKVYGLEQRVAAKAFIRFQVLFQVNTHHQKNGHVVHIGKSQVAHAGRGNAPGRNIG